MRVLGPVCIFSFSFDILCFVFFDCFLRLFFRWFVCFCPSLSVFAILFRVFSALFCFFCFYRFACLPCVFRCFLRSLFFAFLFCSFRFWLLLFRGVSTSFCLFVFLSSLLVSFLLVLTAVSLFYCFFACLSFRASKEKNNENNNPTRKTYKENKNKAKKQTNNRQKQQTDKNNQTTRTTKQQYSHVAYLFSAGSKKRSELSVNVVSAPCGLILEFLNLEKMQHVMQKKWILKMQTKSNCRKKMPKKKEIINAQKMQMQKRNAKQI